MNEEQVTKKFLLNLVNELNTLISSNKRTFLQNTFENNAQRLFNFIESLNAFTEKYEIEIYYAANNGDRQLTLEDFHAESIHIASIIRFVLKAAAKTGDEIV